MEMGGVLLAFTFLSLTSKEQQEPSIRYPLIILTCYHCSPNLPDQGMFWWMLSRAIPSRLKVVLLRLEECRVFTFSWILMIAFVTGLLSFIESFIPTKNATDAPQSSQSHASSANTSSSACPKAKTRSS